MQPNGSLPRRILHVPRLARPKVPHNAPRCRPHRCSRMAATLACAQGRAVRAVASVGETPADSRLGRGAGR